MELGGLHDGGLINQEFGTVIRNHFLYLQLSRVWNFNLLADIFDESVSLLSLDSNLVDYIWSRGINTVHCPLWYGVHSAPSYTDVGIIYLSKGLLEHPS